MRQSLSETIDRDSETRRPSSSRSGAAVGSLLAALGLSVALAAAALVDQLGARTLMDHASDVYASHGKEPGAGLMYGLVYTVAVVGVLLWLGALAAARSGRRGASSWAAVGATVVVAALAVTLLAASEYGEQVYPPFWGVVTLLSALAGAAGAVLLVRRSR